MANQFYQSHGVGFLGSDVLGTASYAANTTPASSYNRGMLVGRRGKREMMPKKIVQSLREREMKHKVVDHIFGRWASVDTAVAENPAHFNMNQLTGKRGKREARYTYSTIANRDAAFTTKFQGKPPPADNVPDDVMRELALLEARGYDPKLVKSMKDKLRRGETHLLTPTEAAIYQDLLRRSMVIVPQVYPENPQPAPSPDAQGAYPLQPPPPPGAPPDDDEEKKTQLVEMDDRLADVGPPAEEPVVEPTGIVSYIPQTVRSEFNKIYTAIKSDPAKYMNKALDAAERVIEYAIAQGLMTEADHDQALDHFEDGVEALEHIPVAHPALEHIPVAYPATKPVAIEWDGDEPISKPVEGKYAHLEDQGDTLDTQHHVLARISELISSVTPENLGEVIDFIGDAENQGLITAQQADDLSGAADDQSKVVKVSVADAYSMLRGSLNDVVKSTFAHIKKTGTLSLSKAAAIMDALEDAVESGAISEEDAKNIEFDMDEALAAYKSKRAEPAPIAAGEQLPRTVQAIFKYINKYAAPPSLAQIKHLGVVAARALANGEITKAEVDDIYKLITESVEETKAARESTRKKGKRIKSQTVKGSEVDTGAMQRTKSTRRGDVLTSEKAAPRRRSAATRMPDIEESKSKSTSQSKMKRYIAQAEQELIDILSGATIIENLAPVVRGTTTKKSAKTRATAIGSKTKPYKRSLEAARKPPPPAPRVWSAVTTNKPIEMKTSRTAHVDSTPTLKNIFEDMDFDTYNKHIRAQKEQGGKHTPPTQSEMSQIYYDRYIWKKGQARVYPDKKDHIVKRDHGYEDSPTTMEYAIRQVREGKAVFTKGGILHMKIAKKTRGRKKGKGKK